MQNHRWYENNESARYGSDAVRKVLARATEIEHEEEALSESQIAALGQELGLAPKSVRRALGELYPSPVLAAPTQQAIALPSHTQRSVRRLFINGTLLTIGNALFFLTLCQWLRVQSHSQGIHKITELVITLTALFLALGFAPLVALGYGWRNKNAPFGMLAGALLGISSTICTFLVVWFLSKEGAPIRDYLPLLIFVVFAAIILGGVGGGVRNWWERLGKQEQR